MLGITGMVVGGKYLAGDSYGYDRVECLEINPKEMPNDCPGVYGVKVRYLDSGQTDIWWETPHCGFSTYVEPLMGR